jgi:DNA-directed RNA polymerase specialized sigma24 family protein
MGGERQVSADDPDFDEAFASLFTCAYRAAFRLVGNRPDAEDVAIEAVARAQTRWQELAAYGEAWVVRTATNLALDLMRRGRPRFVPDPAAGPDLVVEHRVDLVRALGRLPKRQREVVLLRYVGDRSEHEVAMVLGISAGAVKTHASRGLTALRARLADYQIGSSVGAAPAAPKEPDDVR